MTNQTQTKLQPRPQLADYVEPPERYCLRCGTYTPHSVSFPGSGARVLVCNQCGRITIGGAPCEKRSIENG